ncbi:MAG: LON peptidase substrate-binding domain-containing protein [Burkholderiales bacterium]|nr:LON peptidase substrate-binding domain-containing protein [Burkholderiales bacterium]
MSDQNHQEIFIFPLHTVLFPGGTLPLKIFEQRYIEMTKLCIRDNRPFGICQIREGSEVGVPALPEAIGCLATITQWDMPQLGLFQLMVRGDERFRLIETRVAANGLITGHIELLPPEPGPAEVDQDCAEVLKLVVDKVGAANFPSPLKLDDPAWVAYRLAEILPMEATVKQQLLELQDAPARFSLLRRIMVQQGLMA